MSRARDFPTDDCYLIGPGTLDQDSTWLKLHLKYKVISTCDGFLDPAQLRRLWKVDAAKVQVNR